MEEDDSSPESAPARVINSRVLTADERKSRKRTDRKTNTG
jgi:hypothetical protein